MLVIKGNIILELLSLLEHRQDGGSGGGGSGDCEPPEPSQGRLAAGKDTGAVERIQPCSPCNYPHHFLCDGNTKMVSNAAHEPKVSFLILLEN